MTVNAKVSKEDNWVRCANCGHKLFSLKSNLYKVKTTDTIEIKCHSCKAINRW